MENVSEPTLRAAVEAQCRALVERDMATFASFAAPSALADFYASRTIDDLRSFAIEAVKIDARGVHGSSEVAFR